MRKRQIQMGILVSILIVACCPFHTVASSAGGQQPTEWKREETLGIPVWTASNDMVGAKDRYRRISLYLRPDDFKRENIVAVFARFAEEFPEPQELMIYAYSDATRLQEIALRRAIEGFLCVRFASTPEGRRASRNYSLRNEPRLSGCYRATYARSANGSETLEYSPDPDQEHLSHIYLKNSGPVYTGEATKDLLHAARIGDGDTVRTLIAQGADANSRGIDGDTALGLACCNGHADIVTYLLRAGAAVNAADDNGHTPLMLAAMDGGSEIVKLLLDAGADVDVRTGLNDNHLDDTALMLAALHGHRRIVETLMAKGAKLEDRNRFGETPLMQGALAGSADVVRTLIKAGADITARDTDSRIVLMLARNDRETMEALLKVGADLKAKDKEGMTVLMIVASPGQEEQALFARGVGTESTDAAKAYLAACLTRKDADSLEAYRVLATIYAKVGRKQDAVATSMQAIERLGDTPFLRAQLGLTYLEVGDRDSATAQYNILRELSLKAGDKSMRESYQHGADTLYRELNK